MSRVDPVPFKQWPQQMREALTALTPPAPRYELTSEGRPKGTNILGAMAHHPALARAFFTMQGHLLRATTLTERHRELAIMRIAALRRSPYEWAQHLMVGADAGLTAGETAWVVWGPDAPCWSESDACVLRAVDDLDRDGVIAVGCYGMLAWMVASLGAELDDDLRDSLRAPQSD